MRKFIFLSLLFFLFLSVSCQRIPRLEWKVQDENGNIILEKRYDIKLSDEVILRVFYQNDLQKHYQKKGNNDILSYFSSLSDELTQDINAFTTGQRREAKEPEVFYEGDGVFRYAEGENGREILPAELLNRLLLQNGKGVVTVRYHAISPRFTVEDVRMRTEKISSFSTKYAQSSLNRKYNISLAVQKLDNLTLSKGCTFSFNERVGKRTEQNGYKKAVVIEKGEFVEGIGGGVCQVSTTLYNAWLLAGLSSVESHNHSHVVSYVSQGLDAMVSDYSDLVLQNNSDYPIYIDAFCDGLLVSFTLYGYKTCDARLRSDKVQDIPCRDYEISYGEQLLTVPPVDGAVYQSYRDFYKEGVLIGSEKLRRSEYLPTKGKKIIPVE